MSHYLNSLTPHASAVAATLKVLSHPNRLLLLAAIGDQESAVSDLEEKTGIKQPLLSRELAKLRDENLVETRRESKSVFYKISPPIAPLLLQALSAVWSGDHETLNLINPASANKNAVFQQPENAAILSHGKRNRFRIKPDPYRTDS